VDAAADADDCWSFAAGVEIDVELLDACCWLELVPAVAWPFAAGTTTVEALPCCACDCPVTAPAAVPSEAAVPDWSPLDVGVAAFDALVCPLSAAAVPAEEDGVPVAESCCSVAVAAVPVLSTEVPGSEVCV
jgi:hypothetical protein